MVVVQSAQYNISKMGNDLTQIIVEMNSIYLLLNSLADMEEANLHQTLEQDEVCESVESAMFSINEAIESLTYAIKYIQQLAINY